MKKSKPVWQRQTDNESKSLDKNLLPFVKKDAIKQYVGICSCPTISFAYLMVIMMSFIITALLIARFIASAQNIDR